MKYTAYIGVGTNIGERFENLKMAKELLSNREGVVFSRMSRIYETAPVGYLDQASFYNLVFEIETDLEPLELLKRTASVEEEMGRKRLIHWGPRIIDLDILLILENEKKTSVQVAEENLQVPHLRVTERAFVLCPLMDLLPEFSLGGTLLRDYLKEIKDQEITVLTEHLS